MLKAVILIGGSQKGTRFRPLSLDVPKPLFPVAGLPMIQHHIEACSKVPSMKEVLLLGYYTNGELADFVSEMSSKYPIKVRYLQEYTPLGTAGGIYHFRDQIKAGDPEAFFVLNGDVCSDFPLDEMLSFHRNHKDKSIITVMATEATKFQSMCYGSIVMDKSNHRLTHYVEKPSTFISTLINCGVYVCSQDIFTEIATIFKARQELYADDLDVSETIQIEEDILMPTAGTGKSHVYVTDRWWSQAKTAGSAIYANRHYLQLYRDHSRDRLAQNKPDGPEIIGDVFIHPTASVHPTAVLGPNVSVGKNAFIGSGVRIRESIVLGNTSIKDHCCVLYSVIGWNSTIGPWTRLEGTPCDPNPNKPFAKMDNVPLFNIEGKLNPSICILGNDVKVSSGLVLLNCIIMPYKDLTESIKNMIVL